MPLKPENTSVFILAAGKGERMRPLTEHTPKPLLEVGGLSLLEHHLKRVAQYGFKNITINVAYLGQQIIDKIGDGSQYNINIQYSNEASIGALETAGGIRNALHLIKHSNFICINADIWTNFDYSVLLEQHDSHQTKNTLVLVNNPQHNPKGDFSFDGASRNINQINEHQENIYTFSGIGLYNKGDFEHLPIEKYPLAPLLHKWIEDKKLNGVIHTGVWVDIGTPERLEALNKSLT